ncbi:glycosyltransferase [Cellulosimicrobium marinum]|uniref:glycosyltransferase n=1 Tax=Cellulosimicrobium marinum TaxID=1638992 RepID=UPI001E2F5F72|nr:glycosyltransferase [Cellulosimicrobium marinum]MCB7137168.1 glycosyltransferase [Cellulosimicrobium marinum]
MSGGPPFSVLLPVYRGDDPDHVRRAFRSVTADQELRPAEVVVVRDGPVPAEVGAVLDDVVAASPVPVRLVALERNVGLALALEAGLERCAHEIVARQDADDISVPGRFAVQVPLVASGLDIVGSAIREFESEDTVDDEDGVVRVPPLTQIDINRASRFQSPFNHPSVVYRRSAVRAAGGYEDLPLMEDYWLFARMIAAGARALNVAEPLVLYRVGAGSYSRRGGTRLLRSELELQRRLRRLGFTTTAEELRNVAVRGGYRLVPEGVRRVAYRRWRRHGDPPAAHD